MSERLSREELDKISARAKTAREALMWLIRNYGNAMARRQYHQVEAPMNDVPALLAHIAALEAENERLNQLSVDLRACMVEARHKLGLEQDKNDKLWAVAEAARKVSSYTRTEPVDDIVNVLDALDDALAALGEEVGE